MFKRPLPKDKPTSYRPLHDLRKAVTLVKTLHALLRQQEEAGDQEGWDITLQRFLDTRKKLEDAVAAFLACPLPRDRDSVSHPITDKERLALRNAKLALVNTSSPTNGPSDIPSLLEAIDILCKTLLEECDSNIFDDTPGMSSHETTLSMLTDSYL